jgi:hypothetical protein
MLAWGRCVSKRFRERLVATAADLQIEPNFLMACIAFETGRTFDPALRNASGSGAVGLIQFMPSTAQALGTTTAKLARMSAPKQLDYVARYFAPSRGRLTTLADVYMAILWPAAVGKPDTFVLFDRQDPDHPRRYVQNAGLDFDRNGVITKAEATARIARLLTEGLQPALASPLPPADVA